MFCGTQGRFMEEFLKIMKIQEIILNKICEIVLFLFYNVYKEKMFTIEIEDGRNASLRLVCINRIEK